LDNIYYVLCMVCALGIILIFNNVRCKCVYNKLHCYVIMEGEWCIKLFDCTRMTASINNFPDLPFIYIVKQNTNTWGHIVFYCIHWLSFSSGYDKTILLIESLTEGYYDLQMKPYHHIIWYWVVILYCIVKWIVPF